MKDSSEYAAKLKKLYNRIKRGGFKHTEPAVQDVTTELLVACLSAYNTENKARTLLGRLRSNYVDYNELRISRTAEAIDILGKNAQRARETALQLLTLLRSVYDKQDSLDLEELRQLNKRDAKTFLEGLKGADAYVVGRIMLRALGAHAFPVNEQMLAMLRAEEVVSPEASLSQVQGFLERQISVTDVHAMYAALRHHADAFRPSAAKKKTAKKSGEAAKKTAKKAVKKTVKKAVKKTVKKTAAKASKSKEGT